MTNLEQTVETSFFNKVRNGLNRVKLSTFNKIAVYSLAGILGAGLGSGCEGDTVYQPPANSSNNDNSHNY